MRISSGLRGLISDSRPEDSNSKKLLSGVMLRGTPDEKIKSELQAKIKFGRSASLESMQIENEAKRSAVLSLFVIKPKQTGFTAMAELTASAIRNPEQTAVLALRGESGDRDVELDLDKLVDTLQESGIKTFNNTDEAAAYVNESADESGEMAWVDTTHD